MTARRGDILGAHGYVVQRIKSRRAESDAVLRKRLMASADKLMLERMFDGGCRLIKIRR